MIVVLIQYISFLIYTEWIKTYYGRQESVSHSFYLIKHKWIFSVVIWILAFGQCYHASINEWFFLSGVGLGFIGAATTFKDRDMTYWVHLVGTIVAILAAIVGFYRIFPNTWGVSIILIFIPLVLVTFMTKEWIWRIERYYVFAISVLMGMMYLLK